MEILTLTTPDPSAVNYRVSQLKLNWDGAQIYIVLTGDNGVMKSHSYSGEEATELMIVLNKANLSVKSLHKRVIEKLQADGVLVGTISGSPD